MTWKSKHLTSDEFDFYYPVKFALVKETQKAIRIKIDGTVKRLYISSKNNQYKPFRVEGICIWIPKSVVRNFDPKSAYIWKKLLINNVDKEMEKKIRFELGLDKEEPLRVI